MSFNKYDAKKNILISSRIFSNQPELKNIKNHIQHNRLMSSYKIKNKKTLMQSPKLKSDLFRPSSCKPKLFSLLDIKSKTIARGTSLPSQYLRLSNEQLSEITRRKINSKVSEKQKSFVIQRKSFNNDFSNKKLSRSKNLTTSNISNNKKSQKISIKIEQSNFGNNDFSNIKTETDRKSKDRWLPKGYENYEKCVKNNKYFKNILHKNNFIACVPTVTPKVIKEKSLQSDIFFLRSPSSKEISQKETVENKNYGIKLKSDIFNMKNDEFNLRKSCEYKLLKEKKNDSIKNNHNLESKSSWAPANNFPNYYNSPSTEYSIISPNTKNFLNSKEKIIVTHKHNPNVKQKSISEFYNLTKNRGCGTDNFKKAYTKNPNCFHMENNICTLFLDMKKKYEGICD